MRVCALGMLSFVTLGSQAQRLLTLDSCRAMALRNNKQISVSKAKQEVAANLRKSARTKYLPHGIVIPGKWQWPTERTRINEAYLEFNTWASDRTKAKDWYLHPVKGETVVR